MNIRSLKFKFFILLILLVSQQISFAQNKFSISVKISSEGNSNSDIVVVFNKNGEKQNSQAAKPGRRFNAKLDFNQDYTLEFTKKGYTTKRITISTFVPADILEANSSFPVFKFEINLFRKVDNVDLSVYDEPLGIITYDREIDDFDYDKEYDKQIRSRLKKTEKLVQSQLMEQYNDKIITGTVNIIGRVDVYEGDNKNVVAKLYHKNKLIRSNNLNSLKKFSFGLDFHKDYKLKIEKPNYITKTYTFNTFVPNEVLLENSEFPPFKFIVELYPVDNQLDLSAFEKDYGHVKYDKIDDIFYFDPNYQREITGVTDKIEENIIARYKLFKNNTDEAYKLYKARRYDEAVELYNKALAIKPNNPMVVEQLKLTNLAIAEKAKRAQDADNELKRIQQEKYNAFIKQADSEFGEAKYATASQTYNAALTVFKDDEYALAQISKIDSITTQIAQKQERLKKLINQADSVYRTDNLEMAFISYKKILDEYSDNIHSKKQIDIINRKKAEKALSLEKELKLAAAEKAKKRKFDSLVSVAQVLFDSTQYNMAIDKYKLAASVIPENKTTEVEIAKIRELIKKLNKENSEKERLLALELKNKTKYDNMILGADKLFADKQYAKSKETFAQASELMPKEIYPKNKISEIDSILMAQENQRLAAVELDKKKRQRKKSIDSLLAIANKDFQMKSYENSRSNYQKLLSLDEDNQYSKSQIQRIDQIFKDRELALNAEKKKQAEQDSINNAYDNQMALAEGKANDKEYELAISYYRKASLIKPQESLAKDKIRSLNKLIQEQLAEAKRLEMQKEAKQKETNPDYLKYMKLGEDAFNNKLLSVSKGYYQQAISVSETKEAKSKLDEIDALIAKLKNNKIHQSYESFVEKAEKEFKNKQWAASRHYFNQAKATNINNKYCQNRIDEIAKILKQEMIAKRQGEINELIKKAESAMAKNDLSIAKFYYNKVLAIDSNNKKAIDGIESIRKKLN
ncbi:MAG: hypothetical protein N4A49_02810 [Marinifilaceae bacterium]|jgi:hypothetical protein|nr:hypothetical protein [Marinifilaceae bacterium]